MCGGGVVDAANSRAQKLLLIFCDDDEKKKEGKIFRQKKKSSLSFIIALCPGRKQILLQIFERFSTRRTNEEDPSAGFEREERARARAEGRKEGMFRRAADAPALKRAAAYQKALLDLDQLAGRFPHAQLGKAMEAHANVLDAVDAHKRHLFEYGHTKKAEKPLEAMEGLLSRETLGEGDATKGPA